MLKGAVIVLSVNEVIDRLPELDGRSIEVTGLLTFEFENTSIGHFPKAERRDITEEVEPSYYQSSLWLAFGSGSVQPNEKVLSSWAGKRVLVTGILRGPSGPFGCGHFSGWGCEIEPYSIERV